MKLNSEQKIIANTELITIVKNPGYYTVWWHEENDTGYNKLYSRDRAFRFAYTLIRLRNKRKARETECID